MSTTLNKENTSHDVDDFVTRSYALLQEEYKAEIQKDLNAIILQMCGEIIPADLSLVKRLVDQGAELNQKDGTDDKTPLHKACISDNFELVKYLSETCPETVEALDQYLRPPLYYACRGKSTKIAKFLVETFDINVHQPIGEQKETLLHVVTNGYPLDYELVRFLVDKGSDINGMDTLGRTPFHGACQWCDDDLSVFHLLLLHGADRNLGDKYKGYTPLHYAIQWGQTGAVHALVNVGGVNINAQCLTGQTPFHLAIVCNHAEYCDLLLEHNANVNIEDEDGNTALISACFFAYDMSMEWFNRILDAGADILHVNHNGDSALSKSCESFPELVPHLLERNLDLSGVSGIVAVVKASSESYWPTVKLLLENNANPNGADDDGYTPLMFACSDFDLESMRMLLESRANVNAQNSRGQTALHYIYESGGGYGQETPVSEAVSILLEFGADKEAMDFRGDTPLLSIFQHYDEYDEDDDEQPRDLARQLLNAGAQIHHTNHQGDNVLTYAAIYPYREHAVEACQFLLQQDPRLLLEQGERALIAACQINRHEVVHLLVNSLREHCGPTNPGWGLVRRRVAANTTETWEWSDRVYTDDEDDSSCSSDDSEDSEDSDEEDSDSYDSDEFYY